MEAVLLITASFFPSIMAHASNDRYPQMGLASWYGIKQDGNKTASGELFDMDDYTAAHNSLPLGTMVKVTNLRNGKEVTVRINDRGPFDKRRIIDLSRAAAKAIGLIRSGVGRVKVEVVSLPQDGLSDLITKRPSE